MKKTILVAVMLICAFSTLRGAYITDSLNYTVRLGYSIGGTAPIGMPATIRSLNKYTLQPNYSLGFDVQKELKGPWGLQVGIHLENKGMEIDASVMNYHMAIVVLGVESLESLEGYFTGKIVTEVELWMLTVPITATYSLNDRLHFRLGPYISYVTSHSFKGYVYDGYLRDTDPTGPKIDIKEKRGNYDFSGNMRRFHCGIDAGVDWRITKRWGLFGDITWGLTGVHKSSFKTIEQTLYPIFGTLGITYKLK